MEKTKDQKDLESLAVLKYALITALKLLHPYMPFITECVWENLHAKAEEFEPLIISDWPKA